MEKYYRKLSLDVKELTLLATLRMYYHTYCIWQMCRRIGGSGATALYADFWKRDASKSFAATMKSLHMEIVPDVKALGEIVAHATTCAPSLYVTRISNENLHVGYVTWCGNPGILKVPNITRFYADDYIRAECRIEHAYLCSYVEEAAKKGLVGEVEVISNNPRCASCFSSACQFILKRKGTVYEPLKEEKFEYIDYQTDFDQPLDFVLKQLNRTYEEQLEISLGGFFAKDFGAWEALFAMFPEQSAKYYSFIWDNYAKTNVNELKQKLRLGEIRSKEEWVDALLSFGLNRMLIPCCRQERIADTWQYSLDLSQFEQAAGAHPQAKQYLAAVVAMLKNYISSLIKEAQLDGVKINFPAEQQNYNSWLVEVRC